MSFPALAVTLGAKPAMHHKFHLKSSGIKGQGAMEFQVTDILDATASYSESTSKFTGAILKTLSGAKEMVQITRIDRGVVVTLDKKKRTYTERPILELTESAAAKPEEKKPKKRDEPSAKIKEITVTVKKTGKKETIAGFPAEEYLVLFDIEVLDVKTNESTHWNMTGHHWMAPESKIPANILTIMKEHRVQYAKAARVDPFYDPYSDRYGTYAVLPMLFVDAEDARPKFEKAARELAKIKGHPLRLEVDWREPRNESVPTGGTEKKEPKKSLDFTSVGGFLGSMAARKVEEKADEKAQSMAESSFLHIVTETLELRLGDVPASQFEVPANYARVERKQKK